MEIQTCGTNKSLFYLQQLNVISVQLFDNLFIFGEEKDRHNPFFQHN